jgi:hypothetical protein
MFRAYFLLREAGRSVRSRRWLPLFLASVVGSCVLNPQPEPPSSQTGGGSGGTGGSGASSAGGSAGTQNIDSGAGSGGTAGVGGFGGSGTGGGAGAGGTGAAGSGSPCTQAADCALDEACSADTGNCAPVPPNQCGPPASEGGTTAKHAACDGANPCADGLTCVPFEQALDSTGNYQGTDSGVCLSACDPCVPACDTGESCFQKEGGGGFCAPPLLPEGSACSAEPAPPAASPPPCAGGMTCAEVEAGTGKRCLRHCRPEAADAGSSEYADRSASPSPDCAVTEVCFQTAAGAQSSAEYVCLPGTIAAPGGACDDTHFCPVPEGCVAGVCTP